MNIEILLLTIKTFLWIFIIVSILLIILTLASKKPSKKHLHSAFKVILMSAFGLWAFPFISKGPTPGVSVEENLANLAPKSPFYSVLSQLRYGPYASYLFLGLLFSESIYGISIKNANSGDSAEDE